MGLKVFEHCLHSFQWGNISGKTLNILENMNGMNKKHGNNILIELNNEIFE